MERWPNLFIVGAPKAGTTSLHAYLGRVPGIFMSKIKEPHYFSRVVIPDDYPFPPCRDREKYLRLFAEANESRYVGEASPSYLADPGAAHLVHHVSPDAKIIACLRDPVDRIYSHYLMLLNGGFAKGSLMSEIERGIAYGREWNRILLRPEIGLYADSVKRYLTRFGAPQVHVLVFEELAADPATAVARILRFLGIDFDMTGFDTTGYRRFGVARGPLVKYLFGSPRVNRLGEALLPIKVRSWIKETLLLKQVPKPPLEHEAHEFLKSYYRDDVAEVAAMLGRPLPWRNFPEAAAAPHPTLVARATVPPSLSNATRPHVG